VIALHLWTDHRAVPQVQQREAQTDHQLQSGTPPRRRRQFRPTSGSCYMHTRARGSWLIGWHTWEFQFPMIVSCHSQRSRGKVPEDCTITHEQVVCPTKMRESMFATAQWTTLTIAQVLPQQQSFHGSAISLMQHPLFPETGIDRTINVVGGPKSRSKVVDRLPHFYADVPPVTNSIKNTPVPPTSVTSFSSSRFKKHADEERG